MINLANKIRKIFEMIMRMLKNVMRKLKSLIFFSERENVIELMLSCHVINIGKPRLVD